MIRKKRLISLTQKVIRINSENPPGREKELADAIVRDLHGLGLRIKTLAFAKNRPNLIMTWPGTWPRAKAAASAILLTPHMDTVPIGKGWSIDPLGGTVKHGRIYGRGASDDKGNLACSLEVLRSLAEDGIRLKRDLIVAVTADEETGSHQGIVPLLQKKILNPAVACILDSDEFDTIVAQKGLLHCRVQIFGKKAHGAYNWRGVNAIEQAVAAINAIKKHRFTGPRHSLLRPPTTNVGLIKGGDKVNIVADFCEFSLDVRFLPGMQATSIMRDLKGLIGKVTKRYKILIDDLQQPYEIDPHHPCVESYLETARKMGIKACPKGSEGATVITFFKARRIPAFATGFGTRAMAHTTDEYAKIDTLFKGAQLLEKFLKDYDARN